MPQLSTIIDKFLRRAGLTSGEKANLRADIGAIGDTGAEIVGGQKSFTSVPKITAASPLTDGTDALSIDGFLAMMRSPKFLIFRDDFENDSKWIKMATGTGSVLVDGYNGSHFGTLDITTGGTSGSFAGICTFAFSNLWPLSIKPWAYTAVIKVDSITALKLAIGFSDNGNSGNPNLWAVAFSGFDFQPALSANWRFRIDSGGGSPTYQDSGVEVVANTYYTLKMRSNGVDNQCLWSIGNGAETLATGILDYSGGLAASITNTASAAKTGLIDFVSFVGKTNR